MRKSYITIICSLLLSSSLYAKSEAITFAKTYGMDDHDSARSVLTVDDGFLVIGEIEYNLDSRYDMYLLKLDKEGKKIWSKAIGGKNDDKGYGLVETKDGYIAVGTTESFGGDRSSIYVVNLSKDGTSRWQRALYSYDDSYYHGTSIAKGESSYKVVGWEDKVKFFGSDIYGYVCDIDLNGDRFKTKRYGGEDDDRLFDIIKVADGYIMVGETESIGNDGSNAYVVKVDNKGKFLWDQAYGWDYDERANAVAPAKNGYIVVGMTKSDRDRRKQVYVFKIDTDGKMIWRRTFGSRGDDEAFDIVADSDGYVIVGVTKGDLKRQEDVYAVKINEEGKILWERVYGGEEDDIAYGVDKTEDGYIIVGKTESFGKRRSDAYIIKVDKNGKLLNK